MRNFFPLAWPGAFALIVIGSTARCPAQTLAETTSETFAHTVTFELTYANGDLIWLGDPASPAAMLYLKPAAQPIATDMHVRTLREFQQSPQRRYMREARIVADGQTRIVHAFTSQREKVIGTVDSAGRFTPHDFYHRHRELLPSWPADAALLAYDPDRNLLFYEVEVPGPVVEETLDFLPLGLIDPAGQPVTGQFRIDYAAQNDGALTAPPVISLRLDRPPASVTVARAEVPQVFRREQVQLGAFDNESGSYLPDSAYRPGADEDASRAASVTVSVVGKFSSAVAVGSASLVVAAAGESDPGGDAQPAITIDGSFDDWRNVEGVDDPRGDLVPYLEYVPDVDLLEFKVAHDEDHIYLYARVAGQVGRSHPQGGRSYFYAYMDVDQNPDTGFLPTRDDDCYFGVDIGDDCEVQFEFVNDRLLKTFYGFCGLGGDEQVLAQTVTLGKSQYGRYNESGQERADYKSEYIFRDGRTEITADLKPGTSDTIRLAISPDGREVEVSSTFSGFLKDREGRPTVRLGQTIDLAVGMECDSKAYVGKSRWAADSTLPIRGYQISDPPAP